MKSKSKCRLLMILTVAAFQLTMPLHCFAGSGSVDDSTFLETVSFVAFDSGKSDSFYKMSVDKKSRKILLQLSICDYLFGNSSPEILSIFDNGDDEQIALSSTSNKAEGADFSSISNFKYYNKSKTAIYNIEITFLSSLYYNVSIDCNILGTIYKVSPTIEMDFTPPKTTQKETTTKEKNNNNNTTSKESTRKESTKSPAKSTETTSLKNHTKSPSNNIQQNDGTGNRENGTESTTAFFEGNSVSESVTKVEKPKLNKKAKTSIVLAGGIGVFSIIAVICAILENVKTSQKPVSVNKMETDIDTDENKTD